MVPGGDTAAWLLLLTGAVSCQRPFPYRAYYDDRFLKLQRELAGTSNHVYAFVFDAVQSRNSSKVAARCLRDLKAYRDATDSLEPWALQMMDSCGWFQPGMMSGNLINVGMYDQCLDSDSGSFRGQLCKTRITLEGEFRQNYSFVPHNAPIIVSICVPSTCDESDLNILLDYYALKHNAGVRATCPRPESGLDVSNILAIIFFGTILLLIVGSTSYDLYYYSNSGIEDVWKSFSCIGNGRLVFKTERNRNPLGALHGIRFLSQVGVIWYHAFLMTTNQYAPLANKFYLNEFSRTWEGNFLVTLTLAVDTYLFLSGLLIAYSFFKKNDPEFRLARFYTHRFLRTVPPLLAVVIVYATFSDRLCDGPLCSEILSGEKSNCRSSWWATLLYFNNFYPGWKNMCMPHSWYLSADWQLFCLSPVFLYCMKRWPNTLSVQMCAALAFPILTSFLLTYCFDLRTDTIQFNAPEDYVKYYDLYYTQPYTRAGPWIIGLYTGIFLRRYEDSPIRKKYIVATCIWTTSLLAMIGCFQVNLPFQQEGAGYNHLNAALYNSLQKVLWGASISSIVIACYIGLGGPVNSFLSWSGFQPLGKLSYSAYLIHRLIISLEFGGIRTPQYFSLTKQVPGIIGIVIISYTAAFVLFISFEGPMGKLENLYFKRVTNTSKNKVQASVSSILNEGTLQRTMVEMKNC